MKARLWNKISPTKIFITTFCHRNIANTNAINLFVTESNTFEFSINRTRLATFPENNEKKGVESDFRRKCWRNVTSPPRRDYIHHAGLSFRISGKQRRPPQHSQKWRIKIADEKLPQGASGSTWQSNDNTDDVPELL